jgi:hypothetical protein
MQKTEFDFQRIKNIENLNFSEPEVKAEILNILETLFKMVVSLKEENQDLKNEINQLKGEKGKPDIKGNTKKKDDDAKPSGGLESGSDKKWSKDTKKDKIKIDHEKIVPLDKALLPQDIIFKGYQKVLIQDIVLKTNNVLYKLETYYSPSEHKSYTAEMEDHLKNTAFGPVVKAFIATLYFENRVTENKIASLLNSNGILISEGTVSNILIHDKAEELSLERKEIYTAGLNSSIYQQIDDTGMRVDGKNAYTTIVCNDFYSAFFINDKKNRETVKKILYNNYDLEQNDTKLMREAIFKILVCDDAPQFDKVVLLCILCWIHEERHYKKLMPIFDNHKEDVERIRSEIWEYYKELKAYKLNPESIKKIDLDLKFDKIFNQTTSYDELNHRLKLTLAKKEKLLLVLDYPEIPIHNNTSEIGVREWVIKRKISGGVKTEAGKNAWENNLTITATCKKNDISYFEYMKNIYLNCKTRIKLAVIIANKSMSPKPII